MKYVFSVPRRRNTVLHVFRAEVPVEQPEDLGLGEVAEMKFSAYTLCFDYLVSYEIVDDVVEGMKLCPRCTDEDVRALVDVFRDRVLDKQNAHLPDALRATKEFISRRKK